MRGVRARTHHTARKRLRRRMEKAGYSPEEIQRAIEAKRVEHAAERAGLPPGGERQPRVRSKRPVQDIPADPELRLAVNTGVPRDSQRGAVIGRDGNWCRYCGRHVVPNAHGDPDHQRTIDHCTPKSRGGSNWATNRVVCCATCNLAKGSRMMEEWLSATGKRLLPPRGPRAPRALEEAS